MTGAEQAREQAVELLLPYANSFGQVLVTEEVLNTFAAWLAEQVRAAENQGWDAALQAHDRGETPVCRPQAAAVVRLSKIYGDGIREGREQAAQAIERVRDKNDPNDNIEEHWLWHTYDHAARLARGSSHPTP